MARPHYHELQRVTAPWVWALVVVVASAGWFAFGGSLLFGRDLGPNPPPPWMQVLLLAIFGVGFPALILTFRLEIAVDDEALTFSLRPFLRRRVPRIEIARAEAVRYHPLLEYLGWGIKWMPGRGWAYTVQGDRGVRVHLKSGRSFLLGSRRPDELAAALG